MDISTLTEFFKWCTIIDGGILIFWVILLVFAPDFVYRSKRKWFPISREAFDVAVFSFLGFAKILFLFFNLVPYLALLIIGS